MIFDQPTPPEDAISFANKILVGSPLSSSEWQDVPAELRTRAFFSSEVENVQLLQRARDVIGDFLANNRTTLEDGTTMLKAGSRSAFVDQMQAWLETNGFVREDGGLTDITSQTRLSLIFNTLTTQADGYGWYRTGMDGDVLDEFPAQRFIRVMAVKEPRNSHIQYEDQVYLKTDPIWYLVINEDFGVPWGPWAWGCGHDVEDVDRDESDKLHLTTPGAPVAPPAKDWTFNTGLQASTKNLDPDLLAKLKKVFGDKIVIEGDTMRWKAEGQRLNAEVETAAPAAPETRGGNQSPVSDALELHVSGSLKTQVQTALAAIDQVHDDGDLPTIPLTSTRRSYLGFLSYNRTDDGLAASEMAVRGTGHWPALTTVHEAGHFLDLEAIGTKGNFSTLAGDPDMRKFLAAAEETDAIKGLRSKLTEATGFESRRGLQYFLKPEEIWARAYAQFITEESGQPLLVRQLADARQVDPLRQWSTDDFAPVKQTIKEMFTNLGWI